MWWNEGSREAKKGKGRAWGKRGMFRGWGRLDSREQPEQILSQQQSACRTYQHVFLFYSNILINFRDDYTISLYFFLHQFNFINWNHMWIWDCQDNICIKYRHNNAIWHYRHIEPVGYNIHILDIHTVQLNMYVCDIWHSSFTPLIIRGQTYREESSASERIEKYSSPCHMIRETH